jgi:hypothetical protein
VPDDEFLASYKYLYEDSRLDNDCNLLVDLRQAESAIRSSQALKEFANFMRGRFKGVMTKTKVAVVAPSDLSYGLARMYEGYSALDSMDFVVFRAIDAALAWVGADENVADKIEILKNQS